MGTVYRFRVALSGFVGGPGINTWHMCQAEELGGAAQTDLEGMASDIAAVYTALRGQLIEALTMTFPTVVEGFDTETGQLVQVNGITPPDPVVGYGTGSNVSRATQICVRLTTDAIQGNRLIRGRHFIGPIAPNALDAQGQIPSASRTQVEAAYGGVLDVAGNGRLVVWSQPRAATVTPPVAARTGKIGYVQGAIANSVPGTLRSRKE